MIASTLIVLAAALSGALAAPAKRDTCVVLKTGTLQIVDTRPGSIEQNLGLDPVMDVNRKPFLQRGQGETQHFAVEACDNFVRISAEHNGVNGCLTVEDGLGQVTLQDCDGPQLTQGWIVDGMNGVRFLGNDKPYHVYFGQLHGNQVVSLINDTPVPEYTLKFTPAEMSIQ
ncbi:hypothetical protein AURDEDRAFT_123851 [Auricularia subglabra TFB-10046 SS5]|nr:hypothetical protein AURDEDRAFT_123851 [Auricularia subglabra TFB-10046 SS5]